MCVSPRVSAYLQGFRGPLVPKWSTPRVRGGRASPAGSRVTPVSWEDLGSVGPKGSLRGFLG